MWCKKCLYPRTTYDDHVFCLPCTGCSSSNACRVCRTWGEDRWQEAVAFYGERKRPTQEDGHVSDKSDDESDSSDGSESDPPPRKRTAKRNNVTVAPSDQEGTAGASVAPPSEKKKKSPERERDSRSRSRSGERYLRTETREKDAPPKLSSEVYVASDKPPQPRGRSPTRRSPPQRRSRPRDDSRRRRDRRSRRSPRRDSRSRSLSRGRRPPPARRPRSPGRREASGGHRDDRYRRDVDGYAIPPRRSRRDDFYQPGDEDRYDYYLAVPPAARDSRRRHHDDHSASPPRRVVRRRRSSHSPSHSDSSPQDDESSDSGEEDPPSPSSSDSDDDSSAGDSSDEDARGRGRTKGKAKEFKEATKRIKKLLPFTKRQSGSRVRNVAGPSVDQHELRNRGRSQALPQPKAFKSAVAALNKHLKAAPHGSFFAAASWPKDLNMSFRQDWYSGPDQHFHCLKPTLDEDMALFSNSGSKAAKKVPEAVEKTSALTRNSLAVAGFLGLATEAIGKATEDPNRSMRKKLKDIRLLARVSNRAAYHLTCNSMAATGNMDLMRRDVILESCPFLPENAKDSLRVAPLGKTTFFDAKICAKIAKKFPNATVKRSGKMGNRGRNFRPFRGGRGSQSHPPRQDRQAHTTPNAGANYNSNATAPPPYRPAGRGRGRGRGRGAKPPQ